VRERQPDEDPLVEEMQRERRDRWPRIAVATVIIVVLAIAFAVLALVR